MLSEAKLKQLAHESGVTQKEQLLLLLSCGSSASQVAALKKAAQSAGISWVKRVNLSARLSKLKGLAIRANDGWELTSGGQAALAARFSQFGSTRASQHARDLRAHLTQIADLETKQFLEEAVVCCEIKLWRAAVVLSWCGAVATLQGWVVGHQLNAFNAEASRRDSKWRPAKNMDDLARLKEFDFLEILQSISVIGKNVKKELHDCLALRNGCGHPNSLRISEARVAAHLEVLILNVFQKF